ncbi:hypothetical protein BH24ACT13_BH24ACT13_10940 [soil metagenome]|jgi:hypothetical protein
MGTPSEVGPSPEDIRSRATLLPEEQAAGSDDPQRQAEVILQDSVERTEVPDAAPAGFMEHRRSDDTV